MAQTSKLFSISVDNDTTEGKGGTHIHAYFTNEQDAKDVCSDKRFYEKHGVMGTPINVEYAVKEETHKVYTSAQDYWENHDANVLRQRALSKLTAQERELLGV